MSADTDDGGEYSVTELLDMGERTARQSLTYDQYQRWEKLNDLHDQAEETRQEWAEEDERVGEIVVHADREELGTRVDLYGNDVLVHVDPEDADVREAARALDDEFGEREEVPDDAEAIDRLAGLLLDLFDAVLLEWNGTDWAELPADARQDVLTDAREKWGIEGLLLAWADIAAAVEEDREERLDVVESFRGAQRRRNR